MNSLFAIFHPLIFQFFLSLQTSKTDMITIINLFLSSVKWMCYLIDENIGNKKINSGIQFYYQTLMNRKF